MKENIFSIIPPSMFRKQVMSMIKLMFITLITLAFSINEASAQNVTGQVKDINGEALIGVNILVKGTTRGTITDVDGKFTLQASSD